MLDDFVQWAPPPLNRLATKREVDARETDFSGFVFKIQANMDPRHRDRIAFMRVCSGMYEKGMKMRHVRIGKDVKVADAVTFKAGERSLVEEAVSGDIIGLHNHGTIQIGDTFTQGDDLQFTGIPHFAPELFRRIRLRDPMKAKLTHKGPEVPGEFVGRVNLGRNRCDIFLRKSVNGFADHLCFFGMSEMKCGV